MATDPKYLLKWMDLRREEIDKEKKLVESLIPDLKKLRMPNEKKVIVEVFEGKEGWRTAMLQTIEDAKKGNKEILMMSALARELQKIDPIFQEKYYLLKKEAKIKTRYIFIGHSDYPKSPSSEYRFLPESYKSIVATSIHGDSAIFYLITDPLIAIIIKSKDFAESYRSNFESLWKIAKP